MQAQGSAFVMLPRAHLIISHDAQGELLPGPRWWQVITWNPKSPDLQDVRESSDEAVLVA